MKIGIVILMTLLTIGMANALEVNPTDSCINAGFDEVTSYGEANETWDMIEGTPVLTLSWDVRETGADGIVIVSPFDPPEFFQRIGSSGSESGFGGAGIKAVYFCKFSNLTQNPTPAPIGSPVPEFSQIASLTALIGSGGLYLLMKKTKA